MTTSNAMSLYGQTYTQIISNVCGGGNPNFQLIYPYQNWTWATAPSGQIAMPQEQLLGQMPPWSSIGQYSPSSSTLQQAYLSILYDVNLTIPPEQQQQATNAYNQITLASNQLANDQTAANMAYNTYQNNLPPGVPVQTYAVWYAASAWPGTIASDQAAVAKAQQTYNSIVSQQNPQWNQVLAAAQPPASVYTKQAGWTTMNQGDGNIVSVPNYQIATDPNSWVNTISQGGGVSASVNLSGGTQSSALSNSWAGGSGGTSWGFFSIYANGQWSSASQMDSDSSINVSIKIAACSMIPCNPDPGWYNGGYLKQLCASTRSPFNPPFTPTGGSSPVFGHNGIMPTMVSALVVGYQPSATVTMSSSTYKAYSSQFSTSGGFRIGPFQFGGGGGSSSSTWTASQSTNTFTMASTATYPFLMGVIVSSPGLT